MALPPGTADIDYVSRANDASSTVRFAAGEREVTCPFEIKEDTLREGTETVDIKLGALTSPNAAIAPVLGTNQVTTVSIYDNEGNHQLILFNLIVKMWKKETCQFDKIL